MTLRDLREIPEKMPEYCFTLLLRADHIFPKAISAKTIDTGLQIFINLSTFHAKK